LHYDSNHSFLRMLSIKILGFYSCEIILMNRNGYGINRELVFGNQTLMNHDEYINGGFYKWFRYYQIKKGDMNYLA